MVNKAIIFLALISYTFAAVPIFYPDVSKNSVLKVGVGKTFAIGLRGTEGTGYVWTTVEELNSVGLKFVNSNYKRFDAGKRLGGTSGVYLYEYEATNEGNHNIVFQYKRPWEQEAIYEASVTIIASNDKKSDKSDE